SLNSDLGKMVGFFESKAVVLSIICASFLISLSVKFSIQLFWQVHLRHFLSRIFYNHFSYNFLALDCVFIFPLSASEIPFSIDTCSSFEIVSHQSLVSSCLNFISFSMIVRSSKVDNH